MREPVVGDVFDGRFRLDEVLGEGGFAWVFSAHDAINGRQIALKVQKQNGGYDAVEVARFARETELLSRLSSPNTVRIFEHGTSAEGYLFAVFEIVPGRDLNAVLREQGRLPPPVVEHILRQLLNALAEAHSHGLLHRDIKPSNIRVYERDGDPWRIKLLDFGIAAAIDGSHASVTRTGELIGTPRYMSPEQLTDRPMTPASDIYSAGIVAFELLAGSGVVHGGSWGDQLDRLRSGHLFSAGSLEHGVGALYEVIRGMTARDVRGRTPTARAALAALAGVTRAPTVSLDPPAPPGARAPGRDRRVWYIGALVAVSASAALAWAIWPTSPPPPLVPPPVRTQSMPAEPGVIELDVAAEPIAEVDLGRTTRDGCDLEPLGPRTESLDMLSFHVPRNALRPAPVVVLLHDYGVDRDEFMHKSGFVQLSEKHGFLILAPASDRTGPSLWKYPVPLVVPSIERMAENICIDRSRIFLVGHGRGGLAAEILACENFAAGIAMSSHRAEPPDARCPPGPARDPVPAIYLVPNNTGHLVPFGGMDCEDRPQVGFLEPRQAEWAAVRDCTPRDRPFSRRERISRCRTWDCSVAAYQSCVLDGGYPWPGFERRTNLKEGKCDGEAPEFDMAEVIWTFFATLPARSDRDTPGAKLPQAH